jgi:hypothetical protein
VRDHALLLTLARTSLRVSEVRNPCASSIVWSHGRWTARVKVKGGRERTIPFPKNVRQAIDHYLRRQKCSMAVGSYLEEKKCEHSGKTCATACGFGRGFLPEEDRPNGPRVAVISDGLWRNYFGGDPAIVGKEAILNGRAHTIVGILPSGFQFESPVEVLLPLQSKAEVSDDGQNTGMLARLKSGVTHEQARAEVAQLLPEFRRQYPLNTNYQQVNADNIKHKKT